MAAIPVGEAGIFHLRPAIRASACKQGVPVQKPLCPDEPLPRADPPLITLKASAERLPRIWQYSGVLTGVVGVIRAVILWWFLRVQGAKQQRGKS